MPKSKKRKIRKKFVKKESKIIVIKQSSKELYEGAISFRNLLVEDLLKILKKRKSFSENTDEYKIYSGQIDNIRKALNLHAKMWGFELI